LILHLKYTTLLANLVELNRCRWKYINFPTKQISYSVDKA